MRHKNTITNKCLCVLYWHVHHIICFRKNGVLRHPDFTYTVYCMVFNCIIETKNYVCESCLSPV